MSIESAKAFYLKMGTDEAFLAQLDAASPEERIKIAQQAGYDFTEEDFETATAQVLESDELDEEELEAVAGGVVSLGNLKPSIRPRYGTPWMFPK